MNQNLDQGLTIVNKLISWEAQQFSKRVNKAVLFCVEQTVSLHIVLFYVWAEMFLLVSCLIVHFTVPER